MAKFRIPGGIGKHKDFPWGPVVAVHRIDALDIAIVEYHPHVHGEHGHGTGQYEEETVNFHPYVGGEDSCTSWGTLETAIVSALADRRHGCVNAHNGRYAMFAIKVLELETR